MLMITNKQKAIRYIQSGTFDFNNIDKRLLQDRDIALVYMRTYSSNDMLYDNFPINIDVKGMIDNQKFVFNVIMNLSEGYSPECVRSLIKYSTIMVVKKEAAKLERVNFDMLKDFSRRLLIKYNSILKKRNQELQAGQNIVNQLCDYVRDFELDALEDKSKSTQQSNQELTEQESDKYKRCKIGFTADI